MADQAKNSAPLRRLTLWSESQLVFSAEPITLSEVRIQYMGHGHVHVYRVEPPLKTGPGAVLFSEGRVKFRGDGSEEFADTGSCLVEHRPEQERKMVEDSAAPPPQIEDEYLGDGVYASHDGWNVWLDLRKQDDSRIALEPKVLERFEKFVERVRALNKKETKRPQP